MTARAIAVLMLLALARIAHAGGSSSGSLRATPDVLVLHAASGTVTLANDSADPITIASLTRDPGCDDEVTAALTTPATVIAGGSVTVAVSCAAFTSGMKRCGFHAMPSVGDPLGDFEAVCEAGTAMTLSATPTMFDFGDVAVGASASQTFTITNGDASTIAQLALQTTDLGATFELGTPCNPDARECDAPIVGIDTAGTTQVTVWCRPKSTGMHAATLHVASDSPAYLPMPITLACNGTAATGPVFALTGDPVNAGSVEVQSGSSTPRLVRVRNAGTTMLSVSSAQILDSGDGAANDWSFTFDAAGGMCTSVSCQVQPGDGYALALRFDPNAIGARNAVLVIGYNDGAARSRTIPLTGVGLGATLSFLGSPLTLDLGTVPIGMTSSPQTFSLYNQGNRDATVALVLDPSIYTLSPPSMLMVPPGAPSDVMVTCSPTSTGDAPVTIFATATDATLATPIGIAAHCVGTNTALFTTPSVINLGELRSGAPAQDIPIMLRSTGAPLQIASIALQAADPRLTIMAATPQPSGTSFTLSVDPSAASGALMNDIVVTTSTNITVRIPIRGTVVDPDYVAPATASLGSFCVNQPTTSDRVALQSIGTGTLSLETPALAKGKMSPFDLTLLAPTIYPTPLAPNGTASVVITPKRSNVASLMPVTDDLVWTTDVAGKETAHTTISARFVDDGGAVAPSALAFPATLIHLDTENAQRVTLQNCDTQTIMLTVTVPAPFSIDVGQAPTMLAPNETATISVGFHPTRVGDFSTQLVITSSMFADPLTVELSGTGITSPPPSDGGVTPPKDDDSSFYSCNGCSSNTPSSCALALGVLSVALGSRRRRRAD
ncbi:MAG TPA: choice-of-anchor D domain-containing protein [Kofleriaceae bacterium]|jgi:hypothetical protein